jgi:hypothetical protein
MSRETNAEQHNPQIPAGLPYEYLSIFLSYWFADNDDIPASPEKAALAADNVYRQAEFFGETHELVDSLNYLLTQRGTDLRGWLTAVEYDFSADDAWQIIACLLANAQYAGKSYSKPSEITGLSGERVSEWRKNRRQSS